MISISLGKAIIFCIAAFITGEMCGVFLTALLTSNKRFEEKYDA